ncbi:sulfurtransferase [Oceanisphaera avium]|uniref:3-mercaptopyruvate sulfurtransferase n=2 Tax=Oceanisphaera avium TaxID=1903694 RepID=A0A1Y0CZ14_9GAMM|nr:sulfurtransferase [Oceanisphaera avium]
MAALSHPSALVTSTWLAEHLSDPQIKILDASWHMPATGRSGRDEWQQLRIPGAQFFDFDQEIADQNTHLPHMLPSPEQFSQQVAALGISNHHKVIIYDSLGIFAAPRAWWMFKAMGHEDVAVLDGGLPSWQALDLPTDTAPPSKAHAGQFMARPQPQWQVNASEVQNALAQDDYQVLDARSLERFSGQAPDPRAGVRSGHMPGATCLPFNQLLEQGHFLPKAQLAKKLAPVLKPEQRLICSCGSGVTAAIIALAAYITGHKAIAVYDGSWTEWGSRTELPIVTDAPASP